MGRGRGGRREVERSVGGERRGQEAAEERRGEKERAGWGSRTGMSEEGRSEGGTKGGTHNQT